MGVIEIVCRCEGEKRMSGFDWNGNGYEDAGDWYMDYEIMNDKGGSGGGSPGGGSGGDGCGCLLLIVIILIIISLF